MKWTKPYWISVFCLVLALLCIRTVEAVTGNASNTQPLSFGTEQRIIDFSKVQWEPLKGEHVGPGAKIAILHGTLTSGPVEFLLRLPPDYTFPMHSHSSDETFVWLKGNFTYVAEDGKAAVLPSLTFVGLPPNTPHAVICGDEPCLLYVRYSHSFDLKTYPMPKLEPARR
jgi:quercetin dioxygenase-like cupin family protein